MVNLHLNIGSNQNRVEHITRALSALSRVFSDVQISSIFESRAAGFAGDDFYNLGVNARTDKSVEGVMQHLRSIENTQGRDRNQPKFSARNIDLDLVIYGDLVAKKYNLPRNDILKYAFVLAPLAELNPTVLHPILGQTYAMLWAHFQSQQDYDLTQYNAEKILKLNAEKILKPTSKL